MNDGVADTSIVSPRSSTTTFPQHSRDYIRYGDQELAAAHRYEHSPRNSLHSETSVRPARRSASIADLIAASEMSEAEHDNHREAHRDSARYYEEQIADRSMSRSSSASGGFQGALPHSSSHPRIPQSLPYQFGRSERSPSMAHLLNDGTAGAISDRPRSSSHSSISSHVSHQPPQQYPTQMSPLGHPPAYAASLSASHVRDRSSTSNPAVAGSSSLNRGNSPTYAVGPQQPSLSTLNRGGSSPGLGPAHVPQPTERARYATQSVSASYGPPSRSASASYAHPSASSSPASHPPIHLQPSPSHRFAVPEVPFTRSPEHKRVPLPPSPSSMHSVHPRLSMSHVSASSWNGDEYDVPSQAGMPPPQVQASPRRGSLAGLAHQGQRYVQAAPGHSIPPTPGSLASHSGYPVTPGARSVPSHTPGTVHGHTGGDGYEESNYFPRMDDHALRGFDRLRERSSSLTSPTLRQYEQLRRGSVEYDSNIDHPFGQGDVRNPIRTPGSAIAEESILSNMHAPSALPPTAVSPSFGPQLYNSELGEDKNSVALNGRRISNEGAYDVEASHAHQAEERYSSSYDSREDTYHGSRRPHSVDPGRRYSVSHDANDVSPAISSPLRRGGTGSSGPTPDGTSAQQQDQKRPRRTSATSNTSNQHAKTTETSNAPQTEIVTEATQVDSNDDQETADAVAPLPRYAPTNRVSRPGQVMRPIGMEEINRKRAECRNPLRREWEQLHQSDSREALDEILRDFHTRLASQKDAIASSNGHEEPCLDAKKRPLGDSLEDAEEVADHYNKRREVGIHGREESPIIPLRKFNNWIKSVLVGLFARGRDPSLDGRMRARGGRILDLGCGKGGDLKKWEKVRPSGLVGADIAAVSIEQAIARHRDNNNGYPGDFFAFDCFSMALSQVIPRALLEPMFDNVTLQFCMHYAWESAEKARMMLDNVARYLRKGGVFIGTIPDSRELRDRMAARANPGDRSFGNRYYKVVFDQIERWPKFGNRYTFFLEDAVENVPEYVVDFDVFEDLAHEFGLRCIYRKNFSKIYYEESRHSEHGKLLEKMRVVDRHGTLSLDEEMWQAATLYLGFAFEKM